MEYQKKLDREAAIEKAFQLLEQKRFQEGDKSEKLVYEISNKPSFLNEKDVEQKRREETIHELKQTWASQIRSRQETERFQKQQDVEYIEAIRIPFLRSLFSRRS